MKFSRGTNGSKMKRLCSISALLCMSFVVYAGELQQTPPKAEQQKPWVYGPVKSGESLWQAAQKFSEKYDLNINQAMDALYQQNPNAFMHGDKNQLMAGAYLQLEKAQIGHAPKQGKTTAAVKLSARVPQTFEPVEAEGEAAEPVSPVETPAVAAAVGPAEQTPTAETHTISLEMPVFRELPEGTQLAFAQTGMAGLQGPSLKLLNPINAKPIAKNADTELRAWVEKLQQELRLAKDSVEAEHRSKARLEADMKALQTEMRALAEWVQLERNHQPASAARWQTAIPRDPLVLAFLSVGVAALLMYVLEAVQGRRAVSANTHSSNNVVTPVPVTSAAVPVPSLKHIDALLLQGRYQQAQEQLVAVLKHRPADFDALYKLCQVYVKIGAGKEYSQLLNRISARWRERFPQRFSQLKDLYERAWPMESPMSPYHPNEPVYEGDPPADPVQTKLDLARAYIDIGDQVSALEILEEVLKEGDAQQSMVAEVLIQQLTG